MTLVKPDEGKSEDALHPCSKLLELAFDGIRNVGLAAGKTATKQAHLLFLVQVPALLPRHRQIR